MMRQNVKILLINSFALGAMLACQGVTVVVTPAGDTPAVVTQTQAFTAIPTFTHTATFQPALPSPEATSTAGQGLTGNFFVTTNAQNVNLRTLPGMLFPVSRLLGQGTRLQVYGQSPGGEWIYVKTDTQIYGWVLAQLVSGGHDGGPIPTVQPQNVQVVKGLVVDRAGVPVNGVGFAITQGTGPKAPRTDATTDGSGRFYAFLPMDSSGQWLVSYVSIACTSNTMDASCNCISGACGRPDPESVSIALPGSVDLSFVWK